MTTKKMSFKTVRDVLGRAEMRKIMAGSDNDNCKGTCSSISPCTQSGCDCIYFAKASGTLSEPVTGYCG